MRFHAFSAVSVTIVMLLSLFGCAKSAYDTQTLFSMDTVVTLCAENASENDFAEAASVLYEIENRYSRTKSDSELARINASSSVELSDEMTQMLDASLNVYRKTDGAFSPTLGRLTALWDVTGDGYVPTASELAETLAASDASTVFLDGITLQKPRELQFDLGGCAKGYAAAKILDVLMKRGVTNAMINLGGNVAVMGKPQKTDAWRIGIKNPFDVQDIIGYIEANDGVIAVTGAYERFFLRDGTRYHHVFDPSTGYPAQSGLAQAVVYAKDGLTADALSTALFVMGEERARAFYQSGAFDFEAILVTDDGRVCVTEGLTAVFFENNKAAYNGKTCLQFETR